MPKFKKNGNPEKGSPDYYFTCPGCKCDHGIWTTAQNSNGAMWQFNGDVNNPTVSPSLKVNLIQPGKVETCHSFIKDGKIQFLSDCYHELAGKTIELPDYED